MGVLRDRGCSRCGGHRWPGASGQEGRPVAVQVRERDPFPKAHQQLAGIAHGPAAAAADLELAHVLEDEGFLFCRYVRRELPTG